ncbi:hypothetical protein RRG08_019066 [Elysia crispata]|uniref:Uncharacterized protein n=1 Tax=Elysia crispata TaxID=231223 RepID=A0AAE1DSI0_9GAST|nr:hypothetical protein RRG08_019066 [Elysia crispata]
MAEDTQNLWQLTKALNDNNVWRSQTVLLTESGPVAGKAACNVLANAYKNAPGPDGITNDAATYWICSKENTSGNLQPKLAPWP